MTAVLDGKEGRFDPVKPSAANGSADLGLSSQRGEHMPTTAPNRDYPRHWHGADCDTPQALG